VIDGSCLQLAGESLPLAALEQIFFARGGWPAAPDGSEQSPADSREVVVGRPGVFAGALPPKSVGRRIRGRRKYVRRATGVRLQE
jgi:hypothetical protein